MLEWLTTGIGCFITLTYDDEHLPPKSHLQKDHVQKFIRALRKGTSYKVRYFACGEYGEIGNRPHYHVILFGCFVSAKIVKKYWDKGRVHVGELNQYTAQYTAGYVNKKLTKEGDKLLFGRAPEFALMSRKPGIGAGALNIINKGMDKMACYQNEFETNGDVIQEINFGKQRMPLGRYLKEKLRKMRGLDNEESKEKRLRAQTEKAILDFSVLKLKAQGLGRSPEAVAFEERIQNLNRMEKRQKIFSRRNKV